MSTENVTLFTQTALALNAPARVKFNNMVQLDFVQAKVTTSATVGTRTIALQILAADGTTVLFEKQQSLTLAASKSNVLFSFYPKASLDKVTDLYSDVSLPEDLTVPNNGFLKIIDKANVDGAGDTVSFNIQAVQL
jgi:hypothetical protein